MIRDYEELTPIQEIGGVKFKRDDLFTPYGLEDVNGGKLRQCIYLLKDNLEVAKNGVYTVGESTSPQQAIVAAACEDLGLPCTIYTQCKNDTPMMKLAKWHGAEYIYFKGIPNGEVRRVCKENNGFLVKYGVNLIDNKKALIDSVARQVENIPNKIRRLFITCGSGITTTGVLIGLDLYKKYVEEVVIIGNPNPREKEIEKYLYSCNYSHERLWAKVDSVAKNRKYIFIHNDINYKDRYEESYHGLVFHPNYEAHMWRYIKENYTLTEDDLVWIIGSEPSRIF